MLRTGLCVAVCVLNGMPALAEPPSSVSFPASAEISEHGLRHPIDLSAPFHGAMRPRMGDDREVLPSHDFDVGSSTESRGLSLGPLHIGGSNGMGGRHRHLASISVDGMTIFGGSVAGSVDGRSANIVLSWPASP